MFASEGDIWQDILQFNILAQNITVAGFSPLFPDAHCTEDGSICQVITREAEINAALTITSLVHSPAFDLASTYFLIAGIAGVNPEVATLTSVTFPRYAVQVALQYEFDGREKPRDFLTGYVPQGLFAPNQYPQTLYGTEVFELNVALCTLAVQFARHAVLNNTEATQQVQMAFANSTIYKAATKPPSIVECDTATSDNFWTGILLGEAFKDTTTLFTNGTGVYCTTQQEDNGTLEALLRAALARLVDFSRIVVMRTASDWDRPSPGETAANLFLADPPGFEPAILNIMLAGVEVVQGLVNGWDKRFRDGVKPENYIGDIFGSLGGKPDFGLPSVLPSRKRRKRQ
ncbi:purine nucleoside permease [Gymnopus androsaceus JB14]|uniref:Purine nucleoside permease n=1 Tax=Gymnopus androsaceus JB14 TaxID=1447944 RepID=A0A6A4HG79_9AGAR|nr:purine nucleoside permease [Gymnopus androsaceus JB14]